jgi:hypothetical protein
VPTTVDFPHEFNYAVFSPKVIENFGFFSLLIKSAMTSLLCDDKLNLRAGVFYPMERVNGHQWIIFSRKKKHGRFDLRKSAQ